ncbi:hypothetical protein GY45DRAFT_1329207 [Cubamyces sp. BRFM 1775]|nr:hypothetical protein GY45DRAFT_1329207 [Cubamyces sp. BRFM 1775]
MHGNPTHPDMGDPVRVAVCQDGMTSFAYATNSSPQCWPKNRLVLATLIITASPSLQARGTIAMPSIIERLRKRTLSQKSSTSVQLALQSNTSYPSPPEEPARFHSLSPSRSEPLLVDRRIVEDLPALLGALERENEPVERGALKPRVRKRSGLAGLVLTGTRRSGDGPDDTALHERHSSEKENDNTPDPPVDSSTPSLRVPGPSRRSTATVTSPWSTFGRRRTQKPNAVYGSMSPSRRSSRRSSSLVYGSSSSNTGEGRTISNVASTSSIRQPGSSQDVSMPGAPSDVSHGSASVDTRSHRAPHTTEGQGTSAGLARSPLLLQRSPSMVQIASSTGCVLPSDVPVSTTSSLRAAVSEFPVATASSSQPSGTPCDATCYERRNSTCPPQ